jgi:hypothetical protein
MMTPTSDDAAADNHEEAARRRPLTQLLGGVAGEVFAKSPVQVTTRTLVRDTSKLLSALADQQQYATVTYRGAPSLVVIPIDSSALAQLLKPGLPAASPWSDTPLGHLLNHVNDEVFTQMPSTWSIREFVQDYAKLLTRLAEDQRYVILTHRGVPRFLLIPLDLDEFTSLIVASASQFSSGDVVDDEAAHGSKADARRGPLARKKPPLRGTATPVTRTANERTRRA